MFFCSTCGSAVDSAAHCCPSFAGWLRCQVCEIGVRVAEADAHAEACKGAVSHPNPALGVVHAAGSGRAVAYGRGYGTPPEGAVMAVAAARCISRSSVVQTSIGSTVSSISKSSCGRAQSVK